LAGRSAELGTDIALAEFIARGQLDRHLRRTTAAFKKRRDALLGALQEHLADATPIGVAAGLWLSVGLPGQVDEATLVAAARRRGVALDGFGEHSSSPHAPGLVLGFAAAPEATLRRGVGLVRASWEEVVG